VERSHPPRAAAALRVAGALVLGPLKLAWITLLVAAPLCAAWVASSMAARSGGSTRVALASALLVFPVAPALWELAASRRRAKGGPPERPRLTRSDRLALRTLFASAVFLGVLLARSPQQVFLSLNARGDWMLDGRREPWVEDARRWLLRAAAGSQWLYRLTDDNPLRRTTDRAPPRPVETRSTITPASERPADGPAPSDKPPPVRPVNPPQDPRAWPFPEELHAAVREVPSEQESGPQSVGRYLASRVSDRHELAKAVHDYVADRVAYDVESYRAGSFPPQDAETVFRTRRSVCAGYAALFQAIGAAAGLEIQIIVGRGRGAVQDGMGEAHAWNAVRLDDRWHLVDTTWDAGYVDGTQFHKRFSTMYFLTPPDAFIPRHWPDDPHWQLLAPPRTEGDYLRMPLLRPDFFAHGLSLLEPSRGEFDATGPFDVRIDNPRRRSLLVSLYPVAGGAPERCPSDDGLAERARFLCAPNATGDYQVRIFASTERYSTHHEVGTLRAHRQ
jgi:transglutaminase-like putative cysteine protease